MRVLRPYSVSISTVITIVLLLWTLTSGVDYHGGNVLGSLRTSGWFMLGFPLTIALSIGTAAFVADWYRNRGVVALIVSAFVLFAATVFSVRNSLPHSRLESIVGSQVAKQVTIERLVSYDTFNEGTCVTGVLDGSPALIDVIAKTQDLVPCDIVPAIVFKQVWPLDAGSSGQETLERKPAFENNSSVFYHCRESEKIYFLHHNP